MFRRLLVSLRRFFHAGTVSALELKDGTSFHADLASGMLLVGKDNNNASRAICAEDCCEPDAFWGIHSRLSPPLYWADNGRQFSPADLSHRRAR